jgi:hypothetical protein
MHEDVSSLFRNLLPNTNWGAKFNIVVTTDKQIILPTHVNTEMEPRTFKYSNTALKTYCGHFNAYINAAQIVNKHNHG